MTIFNVFTLMGGIAVFLYGMDLLGRALEQTAGSKLQGILSTMTSSPIRGLLLGMAVTAVIQSFRKAGDESAPPCLPATIALWYECWATLH